jgi:hypothetical protein
MRILRWAGLTIVLAAAVGATGCGVEVYDSPGYPGRYQGGGGRYEDRGGDVRGTVVRIGRRDHVIVLDPGDGDRGGRDSRDHRDEIALFYDDNTTVEYQGRAYKPEDLERGDRIQATVEEQGDRQIAEEIQVLYDAGSEGGAAPDRPGRPFRPENPDRPDRMDRPDRDDSSIQREPDAADLRGVVQSVDSDSQSLEIEVAGDDSQDSDSDGPAGVIEVSYDAQTVVQFQGHSYRPENLEEGDVVEIHLRRDRSGRRVADQILVTGEGGQASPSRTTG